MKALLISLPTSHAFTPLNLLYLAGALEYHDISVDVVDWNIAGEAGILAAISKKYDVVGMSVLSTSRWGAFDTAKVVRRMSPESTIVLGGPHATLMPDQCKEYADYVIKGDGEMPLVDICRGYEPVERESPLLLPAHNLIDYSKYSGWGYTQFDPRRANGVNIRKHPRVSIQATRGCTSHCKFCSSFYVQGKYRMREPKSVAAEMEMLYRCYKIRHFYFNDDSFYLDRDKGIEFCDRIIDSTMGRVAFHIETRADVIDEEYARKLKKAGCYRVQVGFETGSQVLLDKMGKNSSVTGIGVGIKNCKRAGMHVDANLIVGNVGETDETTEDTRRFLKLVNPNTISSTWNGLMLLPGTAIYQKAKREGQINDSFWETRVPYKVWKFSKEQIDKWNDRIYSFKPTVWLRYKLHKAIYNK